MLETPDIRNEWERIFNTSYIQPIVEDLNKRFQVAMETILEKSKQGYLSSAVV